MAEIVTLPRRGVMLVLSSPSGAGKSSITRALVQEEGERLFLSISVTTRARRPSEAEGIHYYFIDPVRFASMRQGGELLEWAEVHGNLYATPRAAVEAALARGLDVLFDIDWQGTQQLDAALPEDVVTVFILPPTMRELQARLERRAEDNPKVIANRLANATSEIAHWTEYDYIVINDDLERAVSAVRSILAAERLKRARQTGMPAFVAKLLKP
ncbi:MAG TPA: guanylate kinase [Bauldia sp.]|nr:guanylate kinase [Bauldia sp.]